MVKILGGPKHTLALPLKFLGGGGMAPLVPPPLTSSIMLENEKEQPASYSQLHNAQTFSYVNTKGNNHQGLSHANHNCPVANAKRIGFVCLALDSYVEFSFKCLFNFC